MLVLWCMRTKTWVGRVGVFRRKENIHLHMFGRRAVVDLAEFSEEIRLSNIVACNR